MKQVFSIKLISRILIVIIGLFLSSHHLMSQPDTVYVVDEISPYQSMEIDSLNFPLKLAKPIYDINGDGLCDFVVFSSYALDEKTDDPMDYIPKSAIITNLSQPRLAQIYRNSNIQGIGDYNGDGYNDMIDVIGKTILFGNQSGANFDTVNIDIPENMDYVFYSNDITGDGKSDFIIGSKKYDGLFVYSYEFEEYTELDLNYMWSSIDDYFIGYYDYDSDSVNELLVATYNSEYYFIRWFIYDSIENKFDYEAQRIKHPIHEPSYYIPTAFSDINGDSLLDICYTYYIDGGIHLEVMFGNNSSPYFFDDPIEIEMDNKNRLVYNAGDFNNDGCDDWYSKVAVDTIIMYYGSDSVATYGFNKQYYPIDSNQLVVPYATGSSFLTPEKINIFDYNGDSICDLIFSYWSFDESKQYDTTGMVIYLGGTNPNLTSGIVFGDSKPHIKINDKFGSIVSNIGDFNKDGFDDWAILAKDAKYVNIYYGGNIIDYEYDKKILLPQLPASECFDMTFGDLNNDGWIDIAVSHGNFTSTINLSTTLINAVEEVYIFFGSPDMPDVLDHRDAYAVLDGLGLYQAFGRTLSIPGDYNDDGYNDLVVGGGDSKSIPGVYMYYGGDPFSVTPGIILKTSAYYYGYSFGYPATSCGDINNDGYMDLTLGAGDMYNGKSLIYYGGPDSDEMPEMFLHNPTPQGRNFGTFTPRLQGDFNKDGIPDLVQYNPYDSVGSTVYIYKGSENMDNIADLYLSDSIRLRQTSNIEYVDNFSEKGKSDILILGSVNSDNLLLFSGCDKNKESVDYIFKNNLTRAISVASGDFDNDGFIDVITGNPWSVASNGLISGVAQHYISPLLVGVKTNTISNEIKLTVTPNPAQTTISVQYKTDQTVNIVVTIQNVIGVEVLKTTGLSNNQNIINITNLPKGIYIVSVNYNDKSSSKKIIKM